MSLPPINPGQEPAALDDKLTIETPEQTDLDFPIAGIGSRFLAIAFDTLLQIAALIAIGFLFALLANMNLLAGSSSGTWAAAIVIFVIFVLFYGYYAIFEAVWNGQTPGKRLARIRVIKDSGRPITPSEAVGRNLMRIVDQLPVMYGVGIVSALTNRQHKRLGDFVAGTVVVHEKNLADIRPLWQAPAESTGSATQYGAARLTPEEAALIETFLNRRDALASDVRYRMADQIFMRIRPKLTLPDSGYPSAEKILEALATERRSSARYV
ncbi:MAG: RDD family protein [Candidatus Acidiferrales bacterium]